MNLRRGVWMASLLLSPAAAIAAFPAPVLSPEQRETAMSRLPLEQREQVTAITPTLRHYGFGVHDVETMRVACDRSEEGCTIYGATLHMQPVAIGEGLCLRARHWVSLEPPAQPRPAPKGTQLTHSLRWETECTRWSEEIEGIPIAPNISATRAAEMLLWLREQQNLLHAGKPAEIEVACAPHWHQCTKDTTNVFAAIDLGTVAYPHIIRRPPSLPLMPMTGPAWTFSFTYPGATGRNSHWMAMLDWPSPQPRLLLLSLPSPMLD